MKEGAADAEKRIYQLLSLSMKAGKVKSGELPVLESLTGGKARLLLIARDASENTKKRLRDKCVSRGIPWVAFGEMEALGRAIGASERAGIALLDNGLAGAVRKWLEQLPGSEGGGIERA